MSNVLKKIRHPTDSSGFTIVEILIVLAIAGLIMLIIFEAIPALTRSSRNNQRKQDVTTILQVVSQHELNNSGDFPEACGTGYSTCKTASSSSLLYYATLTYYDPTTDEVNIHPETEATAPSTLPAANNINEVDVYDFEECIGGVQNTASNVGADYSDIVALYAVETGTGVLGQCQQL